MAGGDDETNCIVFLADNDQHREAEYQDIVREISDFNKNSQSEKINWQVFCGGQELNELNDKDVIVVFTSENMARLLDQQGVSQDMRLKVHANRTEHFRLEGDNLQSFLTSAENIRKVFVVESEGCEKVGCLEGVVGDRTFDGSDIDVEEFICKIISHGN